ncbi:MAG: hypothetical protein ACK5L5_07450 [Bacteroidales bacterium]
MLLTLGVPADKQSEQPLKRNDVEVLDISVESSWNADKIGAIFDKIENENGKSPSYVVADNDQKIRKAIENKGYVHVRDISHTAAL